jgi:hypothetical protein
MTEPSPTLVVSQLNPYGDAVSLPRSTPFAFSSTRAIPFVLDALTATETVPLSVLPGDGELIATDGGSELLATLTVALVEPLFPDKSYAVAESVAAPFGNFVESQRNA